MVLQILSRHTSNDFYIMSLHHNISYLLFPKILSTGRIIWIKWTLWWNRWAQPNFSLYGSISGCRIVTFNIAAGYEKIQKRFEQKDLKSCSIHYIIKQLTFSAIIFHSLWRGIFFCPRRAHIMFLLHCVEQ